MFTSLVLHMLFNEKLSHDLRVKKSQFQDHVISGDKFDKICGIIF